MSPRDSSTARPQRNMTALGHAELRQLALKVLTQRAGAAADAKGLAAAAHRAYDDLDRVSAPLIGQLGVDALTGRAFHLVQRQYPSLVRSREPQSGERPFAQVVFSLEQQEPAVAIDAAGAVFATFAGLLITFIGEPLTAGLLRKAWPGAFSDTGTEET